MSEQQMNGKVVVITGASSGFGKGTARKFGEAGASVVVAARRDHLLDELAEEIERSGGKALAMHADVRHPEDIEKLAAETLAKFGHIDVWVNNAGAGALGLFEEVPLEDHAQVIQTDLLGTLYGSYAAIRQFKRQGAGTLINVASVIGKVPAPYFSSYAAAKHGVVGLSASIRQELRENNIDGIHVCIVEPSSFDTPFFEHTANYAGHKAKPIPPVYDPQKVVDAIFDLATHPRDEVQVGAAGKAAAAFHQIAPGVTEKMMGKQTHMAEMDEDDFAPDTQGALYEPSPEIGGSAEDRGLSLSDQKRVSI